jgi:hypothetical protein
MVKICDKCQYLHLNKRNATKTEDCASSYIVPEEQITPSPTVTKDQVVFEKKVHV